MKIKFIKDCGMYTQGESVDFDESTGRLYVNRGVAKEIKPKRNKAVKRRDVKTKGRANVNS